jgi:hypothetical protein
LRPSLPAAISLRQWLASAVLAVCTALAALAVTAGPNPHQRGPQFLLVGVACSPIALLRRWPLMVLAAATVAKALVMTRGIGSLPFAVVLGFASYFAASRLPRRVSITAAAASAAALGGALVYATFAVRNLSPAAEAIETLLPLAAAWFIGDSVAARRRYQAGLAEQAERERAAEAELARQQVREERAVRDRSPALSGARAVGLSRRPGGPHQRRQARTGSPRHGRPRRLGSSGPPRRHR